MKTVLLAIVAVVVGAALGIASTRLELPDKPSAAVAYLNAAKSPDSNAPKGPQVEVVGGELHDFGRMDRYSKLSHTFILRNVGDAPLILEKGETTCKCTVADLKNTGLKPGEQTEVQLEWSAKTDAAEFSQSAEILTNDPARRKVRLLVKGLVTQAMRLDRSELAFNNLPAHEQATAKMKIYGFRDEPLQINSHDWANAEMAEFYDASFRTLADDELDRSTEARSGIEMTVTLKSGLPLGPLAQTIRLTTNYDLPPLEVPIVGRIVGDITVVGPNTLATRTCCY